jgi:hypothetical protein
VAGPRAFLGAMRGAVVGRNRLRSLTFGTPAILSTGEVHRLRRGDCCAIE